MAGKTHIYAILLVLAACVFAAHAAEFTKELTPDNFDSVVDGSKNVLVEFFAPWCGHCKTLAPEWEKAAEAYAKSKDVVIAKVDADAHKDLGGRFGVTGFPTIKYFPKGTTTPQDYDGGRTFEDITKFVEEKTGVRGNVKKAFSHVVVLDESNFDSVVNDKTKNVLVEFYAPWCGHCKKLAPDWEKLAAAFKNDREIVIANVDADKHRSVGEKYGVSGFPTLKFFPKDNKAGVPYEGSRDLDALVKFVNENAGTLRNADGTLNKKAGRIAALDAISIKFLEAADKAGLVKEAAKIAGALSEAESKIGKIYTKTMEKIIEQGKSFIEAEKARLERMLGGPNITPEKTEEFTKRVNVLESFLG